jgi:hypothetical protein
MDGPADTLVYFIAGHVVVFGLMGLYVLSLWLRGRNLRQDEAAMRKLERLDPYIGEETSLTQ